MVILRPTQKLRKALPVTAVVTHESDTALGDWYVNRIVVDRRVPGEMAKRMLSAVLLKELNMMLADKQPFDRARYIAALHRLPEFDSR